MPRRPGRALHVERLASERLRLFEALLGEAEQCLVHQDIRDARMTRTVDQAKDLERLGEASLGLRVLTAQAQGHAQVRQGVGDRGVLGAVDSPTDLYGTAETKLGSSGLAAVEVENAEAVERDRGLFRILAENLDLRCQALSIKLFRLVQSSAFAQHCGQVVPARGDERVLLADQANA